MKQVLAFNIFSNITLTTLRNNQIGSDSGVVITIVSGNNNLEQLHISEELYADLVDDYGVKYFMER